MVPTMATRFLLPTTGSSSVRKSATVCRWGTLPCSEIADSHRAVLARSVFQTRWCGVEIRARRNGGPFLHTRLGKIPSSRRGDDETGDKDSVCRPHCSHATSGRAELCCVRAFRESQFLFRPMVGDKLRLNAYSTRAKCLNLGSFG